MALEETLPVKLYEKLERNGILTYKQVLLLSNVDIKRLTNLSNEDINLVKNVVSKHFLPVPTTCDILTKQELHSEMIQTGCAALDKFLEGGFRKGTITEIYGESGSGKTQFGLQAAISNWSNGCIYICTEDLFPVKRYEEIKSYLPNYSPITDYGKNIFIEHITEPSDLLACIKIRLPVLLSKQNLSLIVIDSVAAPFRVDNTNYIQRADNLRELAMSLIKLAQKFNLAVLSINQVTASFNDAVDVIPSLGLAWSNMISTRLWMKKTKVLDNPLQSIGKNYNNICIRELSVEFSCYLPYSKIECVITAEGIQGLSKK